MYSSRHIPSAPNSGSPWTPIDLTGIANQLSGKVDLPADNHVPLPPPTSAQLALHWRISPSKWDAIKADPTINTAALPYDRGTNVQAVLNQIKMANGRDNLVQEFLDIRRNASPFWTLDPRLIENYELNNQPEGGPYKNCFLHPVTDRMVLLDYVDGFYQKQEYLAIEGPLSGQIEGLWNRVWVDNIQILVFLNTQSEQTAYVANWHSVDLETKSGPMKVEAKGLYNYGYYHCLVTDVTHFQTNETRRVTSFQFTAWPEDASVPDDNSYLKFLLAVKEHKDAFDKEFMKEGFTQPPPLLIHSYSAGVAATFITLDIGLNILSMTGKCALKELVARMRNQFSADLASIDQYLFCHLALLYQAEAMGKIWIEVNLRNILFPRILDC